jgi:hypothetical protein
MAKKKKAKSTVAVKQFTTKQQRFIDCLRLIGAGGNG